MFAVLIRFLLSALDMLCLTCARAQRAAQSALHYARYAIFAGDAMMLMLKDVAYCAIFTLAEMPIRAILSTIIFMPLFTAMPAAAA